MQPKQVFFAYDMPGGKEIADYCLVCGAPLVDRDHGGLSRRACDSCSFVRYRSPAPGVAVLIVEGERYLLCRRRPNELRGGLWCLPCGYVEFDEDFLAAARREVLEETGLTLDVTAILSVASNFLTPDVHTVVTILLAKKAGGHERPGDDIEALGWFTAGETLPPMAFAADAHIIERYFATRPTGAPVERLAD
jgi:ADP-ribose pyrophosphatase YjhB (NUDIX family)